MEIYGWQRYLGIEKDFLQAQFYVSFKCEKVYSEFFTREVILLGAEIEAALKVFCSKIDSTKRPKDMKKYSQIVLGKYPGITEIEVKSRNPEVVAGKPFEGWSEGELPWWKVYTTVKHNVIDNSATSQVALQMLQAYEILLFCVSADNGSFELKNIDMPQLYIPDIAGNEGLVLNNDLEWVFRYDGRVLLSKLMQC